MINVNVGININTDDFPWIEKILSGEKTIETRNSKSLYPYIGKRVGLVKTKKGHRAMLVGYATIGTPIIYVTKEEFDADYDRHLVSPRSIYQYQYSGATKYGYPMINVEKLNIPIPVTSQGRYQERYD